MPENVSAHVIVSGVVQMVGFRSFTLRMAQQYGLTGWVRNVPNGNVEIEVEGDACLVKEFLRDVRIGPPSSRVAAFDVTWGSYSGEYGAFEVRF